jgi:hypothetical protein
MGLGYTNVFAKLKFISATLDTQEKRSDVFFCPNDTFSKVGLNQFNATLIPGTNPYPLAYATTYRPMFNGGGYYVGWVDPSWRNSLANPDGLLCRGMTTSNGADGTKIGTYLPIESSNTHRPRWVKLARWGTKIPSKMRVLLWEGVNTRNGAGDDLGLFRPTLNSSWHMAGPPAVATFETKSGNTLGAWRTTPHPRGMRSLLFSDGHVEMLPVYHNGTEYKGY